MKNWNDMPKEIKCKIVGNMDIVTRTKLKMCSKADKTLVESVPFKIKRFFAQRFVMPTFERIIATLDNFLNIEAHNGNMVIWRNGKRKEFQFRSYQEAFKFMEKQLVEILMSGLIQIERFETNMSFPLKLHNYQPKMKVETIKLDIENGYDILQWLNVMNPDDVEVLDLTEKTCPDFLAMNEIGSHSVMKNAKELVIPRNNNMNDDQLLNLKCEKLEMSTVMQQIYGKRAVYGVTSAGIRRLIEKVIASDYPIESYWKIGGNFNLDTILAGLKHARNPYNARLKETKVQVPINKDKKLELLWRERNIEVSVVPPNAPLDKPSVDLDAHDRLAAMLAAMQMRCF